MDRRVRQQEATGFLDQGVTAVRGERMSFSTGCAGAAASRLHVEQLRAPHLSAPFRIISALTTA